MKKILATVLCALGFGFGAHAFAQATSGLMAPNATLEHVFSSGGSYTFTHNLNSVVYQVHCITRVGSGYGPATYSDSPVDANNTVITVPAAGDYICTFSAAFTPSADFNISSSPASLTFWPTMSGTQSPTFTISQNAQNGYSNTANYSVNSLASGMSGTFSPTSVTGAGNTTLTLSFPASQAAATTNFTVQGTDGSKTHTTSPSITIGNINQGMVECWPLTDGSGSTLADGCGTSNTETLSTGSLTWASNAGLPGTTPTFSSTAYTTGTNSTATNFDGTTPFSVSVWVTFNDTSTYHVMVSSLLTSPAITGWDLATNNSPFDPLFSLYSTGSNAIQVMCGHTLSSGTLYNIVATYDGSKTAAGVKCYVNGSATTNTTVINALTGSIANNTPVSLGGRPAGGLPLNGTLAYVRVYNRVLSATDVANYYAAGAR